MSENQLVQYEEKRVSLFDRGPEQLVNGATEIAKQLARVIKDCNLSVNLKGKQHVRVEGWTTMGALLGIAAVERETEELPDGSYRAVVDLKRMSDGMIVGSGSAICGMDERRWGSAEKYARRSMAITRATSKAFRLGYSWIMALSGHETTPYEEMPAEDRSSAIDIRGTTVEPTDEVYYGAPEQKVKLHKILQGMGVADTALMKRVHDACIGKGREEVNQILDGIEQPPPSKPEPTKMAPKPRAKKPQEVKVTVTSFPADSGPPPVSPEITIVAEGIPEKPMQTPYDVIRSLIEEAKLSTPVMELLQHLFCRELRDADRLTIPQLARLADTGDLSGLRDMLATRPVKQGNEDIPF